MSDSDTPVDPIVQELADLLYDEHAVLGFTGRNLDEPRLIAFYPPDEHFRIADSLTGRPAPPYTADLLRKLHAAVLAETPADADYGPDLYLYLQLSGDAIPYVRVCYGCLDATTDDRLNLNTLGGTIHSGVSVDRFSAEFEQLIAGHYERARRRQAPDV